MVNVPLAIIKSLSKTFVVTVFAVVENDVVSVVCSCHFVLIFSKYKGCFIVLQVFVWVFINISTKTHIKY